MLSSLLVSKSKSESFTPAAPVAPAKGTEPAAPAKGTEAASAAKETEAKGTEVKDYKNNAGANELSDPTQDRGAIGQVADALPGAANAKTAALGVMAAITAASAFAIDNAGSLKAAAQGAQQIPMVGAVMAPLVMVAILLEMEKLNQNLRVFLYKINKVLKQMYYTVQFMTEFAKEFKLVLNQDALSGITDELAEFSEIVALYYKIYKDPDTQSSSDTTQPKTRLGSLSASLKKGFNAARNLGSRLYNKMNTFASVEANKSQALDNIVMANMYFNTLFSQLEFQLKMKQLDIEPTEYKNTMERLKNKESYKAISSGKVPAVISDKLNTLIEKLADDPSVQNQADKLGTVAVKEDIAEQSTVAAEADDANATQDEIRSGEVQNVKPPTKGGSKNCPFIVDRIREFFEGKAKSNWVRNQRSLRRLLKRQKKRTRRQRRT